MQYASEIYEIQNFTRDIGKLEFNKEYISYKIYQLYQPVQNNDMKRVKGFQNSIQITLRFHSQFLENLNRENLI